MHPVIHVGMIIIPSILIILKSHHNVQSMPTMLGQSLLGIYVIQRHLYGLLSDSLHLVLISCDFAFKLHILAAQTVETLHVAFEIH